MNATLLTNDMNCRRSSNCVNSRSGSELPPLAFSDTPAQAMERLHQLLLHDPQMQVTSHTDKQIDAVATTPWLGFKDDVRFVLDAPARQIHYRSMSRVGRYDFGKNASRLRDIANRFAQTAIAK
ncbi:MAG: DUF1499 domain-containing protein [Rhodoferax sp.]|nr:DUF1499 domain-containing protein [Rhodoferax sp.]